MRAITRGPKYHWFGYYDKLQFDPSDRYVLGMEVGFEHRSPQPEDVIKIGLIDLSSGDQWVELGESRAWCWQQGCMLQWLPNSDTEIVWNDRVADRFVCCIMDVRTAQKRALPMPVYALSPDGRTAFSTDFRRVQEMRPGYGYAGIPDPNREINAPEDSGIWRVNLAEGTQELIVTVAQVAEIPRSGGDFRQAKHYFNHLLVSPDGSRLEFLHRWRQPGDDRLTTRMLTVAPDGSDIRVVDDNGRTSHFIWRDPRHILAWSCAASRRGDFCLFDIYTREFETVGSNRLTRDGHVSYLPGNEWLVSDSYPDRGHRPLYLYHPQRRRRVDIARLRSPAAYAGEWRCDLHPRFSRNGSSVVIDSVHEGRGRQMYLVDVPETR